MVDPKLVEWVKANEAKGYTPIQVYDFLAARGYAPKDIREAIDAPEHPVAAIRPAPIASRPAPVTSRPVPIASRPVPIARPAAQISGAKPINYFLIAFISILLIGAVIVLALTFILNTGTVQPKRPMTPVAGATTTTVRTTATTTTTTTTFAPVAESDICDSMACFSLKFTGCEKTAVTIKIVEDLVYYYEILGPKDNLCEVRTKFNANPNAGWINKSMICLYDNSKEFKAVTQDFSNCSGDLYDKISGR